jgi:hypothetical protein
MNPKKPPITLEAYDRAFRRRLAIGIVVSLAVNIVIFGYAGLMGHRFLAALVAMGRPPQNITVRRVFLPANRGNGALVIDHTGPTPTPSPSPSGNDHR